MNSVIARSYPKPVRAPVPRPVPAEVEAERWGMRRVRSGRTYNLWQMDEYAWDAYEARSGLVGHEG